MRLCDSFICAALIVSGSPCSVIVSWLQSNWYASPGAKLIGTNAWAGTRARSFRRFGRGPFGVLAPDVVPFNRVFLRHIILNNSGYVYAGIVEILLLKY